MKDSVIIKIVTVKQRWMLYNEIECGFKLKHANIPKLRKAYIEESKSNELIGYLAFDFIPGKDLYTYLEDLEFNIDEEKAKKIFKEIASIIYYIHIEGVAHRDIKLENFIVGQNEKIYLIDFGLSSIPTIGYTPFSIAMESVGSENYFPPEALMRGLVYNPFRSDIWSLGILLFAIVYGSFPHCSYIENLTNAIKTNKLNISFTQKESSNDVKDLLKKMLVLQPGSRLPIEDILEHSWLK